MVPRFPVEPGKPLLLPAPEGTPEQVHVFSSQEILAIEAALAARRALLVRGEPGTGKTQLAKAAAVALKRAFISLVVDSRTESRDVLWHFDAIARLARAQVLGALPAAQTDLEAIEAHLDIGNFIQPRPLWWAYDWPGALDQAKRSHGQVPQHLSGCDPANGAVILIDEIDKAESEVPNGLLESLGSGEFTPQGFERSVKPAPKTPPPLVIITTNEDRGLPDAFLRRCLVLHLALPTGREALVTHLIVRGEAHFPKADKETLRLAATMVAEDRETARKQNWWPLPGQAEFMDLVRAVIELHPDDLAARKAALDTLRTFTLLRDNLDGDQRQSG